LQVLKQLRGEKGEGLYVFLGLNHHRNYAYKEMINATKVLVILVNKGRS
jgi:hypothetical protein